MWEPSRDPLRLAPLAACPGASLVRRGEGWNMAGPEGERRRKKARGESAPLVYPRLLREKTWGGGGKGGVGGVWVGVGSGSLRAKGGRYAGLWAGTVASALAVA